MSQQPTATMGKPGGSGSSLAPQSTMAAQQKRKGKSGKAAAVV